MQRHVRKWSAWLKLRTNAEENADAFHRSTTKDRLCQLFICCHPKLTEDAQLSLILNTLFGYGAGEIARARLVRRAAAEKSLARAKSLRAAAFDFESGIAARLPAVQRALYLLFHDGCHAGGADLCKQAIDLVCSLLEHPQARSGPTYGLAALMCLEAARLPARTDGSKRFIPTELEDRAKWDVELVAKGFVFLERSARSWESADYQIEAAIAAAHASAQSAEDTDWDTIVALYDSLLAVRPSAIVALNRAIAVGRTAGPERGLAEILSISDSEILQIYPFYWATLGEFALRGGRRGEAKRAFRKARELARNPFERDHYAARIAACSSAAA